MRDTWIVTADRTEARILARTEDGLVLVQALTDPSGRLRDGEVGTDRPGRSFDRSGRGRHALEEPVSTHEHAAQLFASQIAQFLRHARLEGRFARLVLFVEPRFLGVLRAALDKQTSDVVVRSVAKDLQHLPPHELIAYLSDA